MMIANLIEQNCQDQEGPVLQKNQSGQKAALVKLQEILKEMNKEGNFPISLLTDNEGLPYASSVDDHLDTDTHSAVVALIQKAAVQVSRHIGMAKVDEISLSDGATQRLICRPFKHGKQELILTIMLTHKEQSYRRLTNQTISKIKSAWSQQWK